MKQVLRRGEQTVLAHIRERCPIVIGSRTDDSHAVVVAMSQVYQRVAPGRQGNRDSRLSPVRDSDPPRTGRRVPWRCEWRRREGRRCLGRCSGLRRCGDGVATIAAVRHRQQTEVAGKRRLMLWVDGNQLDDASGSRTRRGAASQPLATVAGTVSLATEDLGQLVPVMHRSTVAGRRLSGACAPPLADQCPQSPHFRDMPCRRDRG